MFSSLSLCLIFSDKLWRAVKLRTEYGSVMKEVEEAKRRKQEELIKLPTNVSQPGQASSGG